MSVYAIADLHLSGARPKPMDIFGPIWQGHAERLAEGFSQHVTQEDLVLVPGDISWAMNLSEALVDIQTIAAWPGQKLLLRGNHDYWWSSISKLRQALPAGVYGLQNDCFCFENYTICGTRGWTTADKQAPQDQKIFLREVLRLELSLRHARARGREISLVMLHFPPFEQAKQADNALVALLHQYQVKRVVYGHLHGTAAHKNAFCGTLDGIHYQLVSADYLNFQPKKILD